MTRRHQLPGPQAGCHVVTGLKPEDIVVAYDLGTCLWKLRLGAVEVELDITRPDALPAAQALVAVARKVVEDMERVEAFMRAGVMTRPSGARRALLRDLAFREPERTTSGRTCWLIPVDTARLGLVVPVFAESFEALRQVNRQTVRAAVTEGLVTVGERQEPPAFAGQHRDIYVRKQGRPITLTDEGRRIAGVTT